MRCAVASDSDDFTDVDFLPFIYIFLHILALEPSHLFWYTLCHVFFYMSRRFAICYHIQMLHALSLVLMAISDIFC